MPAVLESGPNDEFPEESLKQDTGGLTTDIDRMDPLSLCHSRKRLNFLSISTHEKPDGSEPE